MSDDNIIDFPTGEEGSELTQQLLNVISTGRYVMVGMDEETQEVYIVCSSDDKVEQLGIMEAAKLSLALDYNEEEGEE